MAKIHTPLVPTPFKSGENAGNFTTALADDKSHLVVIGHNMACRAPEDISIASVAILWALANPDLWCRVSTSGW